MVFPALDNHVIIEINNMAAAGREFQGTKSREILSQLIDRVGELSDALDAQEPNQVKKGGDSCISTIIVSLTFNYRRVQVSNVSMMKCMLFLPVRLQIS